MSSEEARVILSILTSVQDIDQMLYITWQVNELWYRYRGGKSCQLLLHIYGVCGDSVTGKNDNARLPATDGAVVRVHLPVTQHILCSLWADVSAFTNSNNSSNCCNNCNNNLLLLFSFLFLSSSSQCSNNVSNNTSKGIWKMQILWQ